MNEIPEQSVDLPVRQSSTVNRNAEPTQNLQLTYWRPSASQSSASYKDHSSNVFNLKYLSKICGANFQHELSNGLRISKGHC